MHISMCIKWLLDMDPLLASFSYLVLLDKHMSICAEHAATSRIVKAACKLMPGRSRLCALLLCTCNCTLYFV